MKIRVNRVNRALACPTPRSLPGERLIFRVKVECGESVMACIDVDALAQYEVDAKQGRPDALYNLGLAYSTGQGVGVDFIAAHKWFNLAAVKGRDEAKGWRAQ